MYTPWSKRGFERQQSYLLCKLLTLLSAIFVTAAVAGSRVELCHTQLLGRSSKPPVVIMHGLLSNARQMKTFSQQLYKSLGEEHTVICIDLPNHGESCKHGPIRMGYPQLAIDVIHTLEGLNVKRCHMLGSSIGGKCAAAVALYPSSLSCESITLIDVCPTEYTVKDFLRVSPTICFLETIEYLMKIQDELVKASSSKQEIANLLRNGIKDSSLVSFLLSNVIKNSADDSFCFNFLVDNAIFPSLSNLAAFPFHHSISSSKVPTLIYKASESTHVTIDHLEKSKMLFPLLTLLTEHGTTHKMLFEKPDKIAANVAAFIREARSK